MSLWRRTRPGMVRVSSKALVALLRDALRAAELEAEGAAISDEIRSRRRTARAHELVDQFAPTAGVASGDPLVTSLLEDPPQAADGRLHEPAFLALLDTRLWDCRLRADPLPSPTLKEN